MPSEVKKQNTEMLAILDEALNALPEDAAPENAEPVTSQSFVIQDESGASWAVGKMLTLKANVKRVKEQAAAMVKDYENDLRRLEFVVLQSLGTWSQQAIADKGGKKKSIKLLEGTVGFRAKKEVLKVEDDGVLLEWCKKHLPDAIEIVPAIEKLKKKEINEYFDMTGEIPDGTFVEDASETFYYK